MIPAEDSMTVAQKIKEQYSYVCPDIVKEFKKYEQEGDKYFKTYEGVHSVTGKVRRTEDMSLTFSDERITSRFGPEQAHY
jgi:hypothetical protein